MPVRSYAEAKARNTLAIAKHIWKGRRYYPADQQMRPEIMQRPIVDGIAREVFPTDPEWNDAPWEMDVMISRFGKPDASF